MSTRTQTARYVCSAVAVALVWLAAAVVDQAQAEAWVPVDHTQLDAVFVEQGAVLEGYRRIMMDPLSVWFGEYDTTDARLDECLAAFRAAYSTAFAGQLARRGLELVHEPGPGVLRLHVEIVDLMVNDHTAAQLLWAERFSFPTAPDHLTLVAELSDASTGAVLMRIADLGLSREGPDIWPSVRRSFEAWAYTLAGVVADRGQAPSLASR